MPLNVPALVEIVLKQVLLPRMLPVGMLLTDMLTGMLKRSKCRAHVCVVLLGGIT